jgi:hypothetical protein
MGVPSTGEETMTLQFMGVDRSAARRLSLVTVQLGGLFVSSENFTGAKMGGR